ncbi:hypothetical protein R3P38DRAFT_894699 [Favolaschia claudopus]|uniref:Uncharacterized protein n=1 Tax=Favolaschia claudopus TaxID=2862362 RepID=A0AAW0BU17_9AGAR
MGESSGCGGGRAGDASQRQDRGPVDHSRGVSEVVLSCAGSSSSVSHPSVGRYSGVADVVPSCPPALVSFLVKSVSLAASSPPSRSRLADSAAKSKCAGRRGGAWDEEVEAADRVARRMVEGEEMSEDGPEAEGIHRSHSYLTSLCIVGFASFSSYPLLTLHLAASGSARSFSGLVFPSMYLFVPYFAFVDWSFLM